MIECKDGSQKIEQEGVKAISLVCVDNSLFQKALSDGIINQEQLKLLQNFFKNPDETMRNFLIAHPEFLETSLNSDEKTKKRAKLLIENNLYDLPK